MKIYQTDLLKRFTNLTHAFTTKDGGVSPKPYDSLNLAFHVEDRVGNVEKNHLLLAKELSYTKDKLIHMKQIHSDIVHIVAEDDTFTTPPTCDALITDRLNTPLMVMAADCSPILFYDAKRKVIAVAHAGRQGAFKNIITNVLNSFVKNYKSETDDIYVVIGASIGKCCYEVGAEIYEEAKERGVGYAIDKKETSYHLDISQILQKQLIDFGIKEDNIDISKECTCCNSDKYFSYRADGVTGRFCGIIKLD